MDAPVKRRATIKTSVHQYKYECAKYAPRPAVWGGGLRSASWASRVPTKDAHAIVAVHRRIWEARLG